MSAFSASSQPKTMCHFIFSLVSYGNGVYLIMVSFSSTFYLYNFLTILVSSTSSRRRNRVSTSGKVAVSPKRHHRTLVRTSFPWKFWSIAADWGHFVKLRSWSVSALISLKLSSFLEVWCHSRGYQTGPGFASMTRSELNQSQDL